MKKVVFVVALMILAGWAWYLNQGTKSDTGTEVSALDKAMQLMQNIQSRALTEDNIAVLEQVYQDSVDRIPQIKTLRDADVAKLTKLLNDNGVTGTLSTGVINSAKVGTPDAVGYIDTQIAAMTNVSASVKANIKSIYNSAKTLSREIRLRTDYVSTVAPTSDAEVVSYGYWRKNICTTTDSSLNLYIQGTVSPKPNIATFTAKVDTCTGTTLKQYKCENNQYIATAAYEQTDTCTYGCTAGACLKWKIVSVTTTKGNTAASPATTDIKLNEEFYLKVNAGRITGNDVIKVATVWTNPTGGTCTLETPSQPITASGDIFFGPIVCSKNGAAKFTVSVQDSANAVIGTAVVQNVAIGTSTMNGLEVSAVSVAPFRKNTNIQLKVTAKGTNGLDYPSYTGNLIFQVTDESGATDADDLFPFVAQKLGGAEKEFTFKFASAGDRIVKVRGGSDFEASFPITIVD